MAYPRLKKGLGSFLIFYFCSAPGFFLSQGKFNIVAHEFQGHHSNWH